MRLPALVTHADWSKNPRKRWCARARRVGTRYEVDAPYRVGAELQGLLGTGVSGGHLVGVDFAIGVPGSYARLAGITSFRDWVLGHGTDPWHEVTEPAGSAAEISLWRPFYPRRPGGTSQAQLVAGLGVASMADLYRQCEAAVLLGRRPCSLFWLLGPNQVGRSALSGWELLVRPALRGELAARLWPFDGPLRELLAGDVPVLAETYPAACYSWLGLGSFKKSAVGGRRSVARRVLQATDALDVRLTASATRSVLDGFDDDDSFDAFVGVLGMVAFLRRCRAWDPPHQPESIRSLEGWILGAGAPGLPSRPAPRRKP